VSLHILSIVDVCTYCSHLSLPLLNIPCHTLKAAVDPVLLPSLPPLPDFVDVGEQTKEHPPTQAGKRLVVWIVILWD